MKYHKKNHLFSSIFRRWFDDASSRKRGFFLLIDQKRRFDRFHASLVRHQDMRRSEEVVQRIVE